MANESEDAASLEELKLQHKKFVWQAQCGEGIMQHKSESMDKIGILAGFLTAFMISVVLELDMSSFESIVLFHVFAAFSSISVAAGLSAILIMTAVSAKIQRLRGRSHLFYGADTNAEDIQIYGCQYYSTKEWKTEKYFTHWLNNQEKKESARLYAYNWYQTGYDNGPTVTTGSKDAHSKVMAMGFYAFQVLIFAVVGATVTKCLDAIGDDVNGYIIGVCHGMVLIIPTMYTMIILKRSAALNDLF
mmetsp:Transcript_3566/g.4019  ORF Transcript_3566/g.4019 Transcript_3566/m.4019 type:complete len:246 (+) Transcript_3566:104-841(+)